jgi:ABC-type multidrug transport system fused ATPase/permease subunit
MVVDTKKDEIINLPWLQVPKAIWRFLGEKKAAYVTFNILLFAVFFYELVPPYIIGKIVDFFVRYRSGDSLRTPYMYIVILAVTSIFIAFVRLRSKNELGKIGIAARTTARVEGFERLLDFSLQWHTQENSGNKVQRIFTGSQSIPDWVNMTNNGIFPVITAFIGVLGVFLFLSPVFLIFLVSYSILFFWIEIHFNRKIESLTNQLNKSREESSGKYIEGAGNILAIKALGAEKGIQSKVKQTEELARGVDFEISNTATHKWYSFQTLNGVALATFLLLVLKDIVNGAITVGYVFVFFTYFNNLRNATEQAATQVSSRAIQLKADLLRMMPIFTEETMVKTGKEHFPKYWDKISIKSGTFKYPSGQVGLNNLDFVLPHGRKVGIAGASGSGKSTLIKILLGLYPLEQGDFKIGNKNYYNISHEEITKHTAVVLQETELFNFSLRENITLMREVDSELLEKAIDIAELSEVVIRLPEGLDTLIGERGYTLSGGERQRLGIARAIYKNAPILFLDEATSALDSKTEKVITDKLISRLEDKTVVIVAHRISTLRGVDQVLVFDKGGLVESGVYEHLIKDSNSKLGELYALQR